MFRYEELFAPVGDQYDVEEILAQWRWLVPETVAPLFVTAFGDMFLLLESGAVRFLDTLAGTCDQVAPSADAWKEMLRSPEQIEEWFMPAMVILLREAGESLSQGQCYSPVQSLVTGGALAVDNFKPTFWSVHMAFSGTLHEKVKKLPPGTRITGLKR